MPKLKKFITGDQQIRQKMFGWQQGWIQQVGQIQVGKGGLRSKKFWLLRIVNNLLTAFFGVIGFNIEIEIKYL